MGKKEEKNILKEAMAKFKISEKDIYAYNIYDDSKIVIVTKNGKKHIYKDK
jgi:pyruvate/2-oxoacid:ferredoxin oxidoreductase alpha subunit